MRFSYQTLYSFILNDQIPCFHRKKKLKQKQIQTAILKVNTSEHIQKKVYTFFFFLLYGFYNQVWFQRKTKMAFAGASTLKRQNFMGHVQASAVRIVNIHYYYLIFFISQIIGLKFYIELHFRRGLGRIVLGKYIFCII